MAVLRAGWLRRRLLLYAAVAVGCLVGSMMPLVASAVTVAGLLAARFLVVRSALGWLSPKRRMSVRLLLRLGLIAVALLAFVGHELLTLVPLFGWIGKVALGLLALVGYTEAAVGLIATRLQRDRQGPVLDTAEWGVPLLLLALLVGLAAAGTLAMVWLWRALDGALPWLKATVLSWY